MRETIAFIFIIFIIAAMWSGFKFTLCTNEQCTNYEVRIK